MNPIRISARDLGEILLADFCERCFWLTKRFPLTTNHPFASPIPGIVSQTDAYAKRVINTHLQENGSLPSWLISALNSSFQELDFQVVCPIKPTRWRISLLDDRFTLAGEADAIWEFTDGRWFIADYKVASWTSTQEHLLPLYQAQLNAYAYLAQKLHGKTIAGLALIYFEPQHSPQIIADPDLLQRTKEQMMLGFKCTVKPVDLKPANWVEDLCQQVFNILSSETPPKGRQDCQPCQALADWWSNISRHLP